MDDWSQNNGGNAIIWETTKLITKDGTLQWLMENIHSLLTNTVTNH